jgi:hypothetical protein
MAQVAQVLLFKVGFHHPLLSQLVQRRVQVIVVYL